MVDAGGLVAVPKIDPGAGIWFVEPDAGTVEAETRDWGAPNKGTCVADVC